MGRAVTSRSAEMAGCPPTVLVAAVTGPLALASPTPMQVLYLGAWVCWGLRRWATREAR